MRNHTYHLPRRFQQIMDWAPPVSRDRAYKMFKAQSSDDVQVETLSVIAGHLEKLSKTLSPMLADLKAWRYGLRLLERQLELKPNVADQLSKSQEKIDALLDTVNDTVNQFYVDVSPHYAKIIRVMVESQYRSELAEICDGIDHIGEIEYEELARHIRSLLIIIQALMQKLENPLDVSAKRPLAVTDPMAHDLYSFWSQVHKSYAHFKSSASTVSEAEAALADTYYEAVQTLAMDVGDYLRKFAGYLAKMTIESYKPEVADLVWQNILTSFERYRQFPKMIDKNRDLLVDEFEKLAKFYKMLNEVSVLNRSDWMDRVFEQLQNMQVLISRYQPQSNRPADLKKKISSQAARHIQEFMDVAAELRMRWMELMAKYPDVRQIFPKNTWGVIESALMNPPSVKNKDLETINFQYDSWYNKLTQAAKRLTEQASATAGAKFINGHHPFPWGIL